MKRYRVWLLLVLAVLLLTGCSSRREQNGGERQEVEFAVVDERKLPEQLLQIIEENKEHEMRMTFADDGVLYLIRGYGKQKSGGYSIAVTECTEDEEKLYFDTRLIGPQDRDHLPQDPSYPYIVVRVEARDQKDAEIT